MENLYVLVLWPESQAYMEKEWFRAEAILAMPLDSQEDLSSAYFIPKERYDEVNE
jgi:hypothetical protein